MKLLFFWWGKRIPVHLLYKYVSGPGTGEGKSRYVFCPPSPFFVAWVFPKKKKSLEEKKLNWSLLNRDVEKRLGA